MGLTEPFTTLAGKGDSEHVVDRSRFLGWALPFEDLDEALSHVAALKKEHYDARHVCYGLRIGHGAQCIDRSNDDGEPARTGGFPLWQLLDGDEVTNAMIVVVRYYGGVKLGTGGLARAYRDAGRMALDAAGKQTIYPETEFRFDVEYSVVDKLQHTLKPLESVRIDNTEYTDVVTFTLAVRKVDVSEVAQLLGQLLQRDPESFQD